MSERPFTSQRFTVGRARSARRHLRLGVPLLAVAACAALGVASCSRAGDGASGAAAASLVGEAVQTAPTQWWWYAEIPGDMVTQKLAANGARLNSIQVTQTNPLLFTVTMVKNSGSYGKQWWWFPGVTPQDLVYRAQVLNARPISIDPYLDGNGNTLLAAVLISNTGTDAKQWWLFTDVDGPTLGADLSNASRRLVDWRQYTKNGATLNAAIAVANSGPDGTAFWYYPGQTPAQIQSLLSNGARTLVGIQPADPRTPTFNVILYSTATLSIPTVNWWYGQTYSQLQGLVDPNQWRFSDLKTYVWNGTTYHVVITVNNAAYSGTAANQAACDANVVAGWNATPPAVGVGLPSTTAIYDAAVTKFMKQWNLPGAGIGVVKDGKLVLARGYGLADRNDAQLAHPDSRFRIASLSKGLTAAAVLAAVDKGLFGLDDAAFPMLGLSPNPSTCCAPNQPGCTQTTCTVPPLLSTITIRNLLNHTAGFSRESNCTINVPAGAPTPIRGNNSACSTAADPLNVSDELLVEGVSGNSVPLTCQQVIQYWMVNRDNIGGAGVGNAPALVWTPAGTSTSGAVKDYSNFGYCVLQAVIEKKTGTSYANWVATQVLNPAGAGAITPGRTNINGGGGGYVPTVLDHEVSYYDSASSTPGQSIYDTRNLCKSEGLCVANPYGGIGLETGLAEGGWLSSPLDLLRVEVALDGSNGKTALLTGANISDLEKNPNAWTVDGVDKTQALILNPPNRNSWYGFGFNVNSREEWSNFGGFNGTWTYEYRGGPKGQTDCFDASGNWCSSGTAGCVCSPVATAHYGWVAFFNSSLDSDQSAALDRMMQNAWWQAVTTGASWPTGDLFDQYGGYTAWMNASDYQNYFNTQAASGKYPTRVEGQSQVGTPMYRAVFAPFATTQGTNWTTHNGMDCLTYQQYQQSLSAQGYRPTSLQSYVGNDGLRRYQATWTQYPQ